MSSSLIATILSLSEVIFYFSAHILSFSDRANSNSLVFSLSLIYFYSSSLLLSSFALFDSSLSYIISSIWRLFSNYKFCLVVSN